MCVRTSWTFLLCTSGFIWKSDSRTCVGVCACVRVCVWVFVHSYTYPLAALSNAQTRRINALQVTIIAPCLSTLSHNFQLSPCSLSRISEQLFRGRRRRSVRVLLVPERRLYIRRAHELCSRRRRRAWIPRRGQSLYDAQLPL